LVIFLFVCYCLLFFFSSRRRHTRFSRDWSSDVCSSDLVGGHVTLLRGFDLSCHCVSPARLRREEPPCPPLASELIEPLGDIDVLPSPPLEGRGARQLTGHVVRSGYSADTLSAVAVALPVRAAVLHNHLNLSRGACEKRTLAVPRVPVQRGGLAREDGAHRDDGAVVLGESLGDLTHRVHSL